VIADGTDTGLPRECTSRRHASALQRNAPIAQSITRSITLYQSGGTLRIPETGLTLMIPRNAIGNAPITISVTALPRRAVAYSFEPHGTRFLDNLTLSQDLGNTSWKGNTGRIVLGGGYFNLYTVVAD
jgi:hypothetical protein